MYRCIPVLRVIVFALCLTTLTVFSTFATAAPQGSDWTLETVGGANVTFFDQLEKGPVVVSFWATWCKPCLKEMPHLNRMAGQLAGQVSFLAANTDNSKSVAKVTPFIQSKNFTNLIVPLDTGAELQELLQTGGTVPFLILFDTNGHEVYRHIGYKEGDEVELEHEIAALLAKEDQVQLTTSNQGIQSGIATASDKFKYSYSKETQKEIFENWLDVSYQFGSFRTGILLNSKAPDEDGLRSNTIEHRFFEFNTGDFDIRAGHFYGIFGRGLLFNAYEDRVVRIDTRLDGITASIRRDNFTATVFSGSPSVADRDVRGTDIEYSFPGKLKVGLSGITYGFDQVLAESTEYRREWAASLRARQNFGFGDYYVEYGIKEGWDYNLTTDQNDEGYAFYGNLNLYHGPFSISWEGSDYDKFAIVTRADGTTSLNRPPSLAREFAWTLMNRSPHNLDANDEKGNNLDLMYCDDQGWTVVGSAVRLKNHDDLTLYELIFGSIQKSNIGPLRLTGGFGYQDSEGLRQIIVGEVTWMQSETVSWTLQGEHQHVRMGGGYGFNDGAYDEDWFKLEYETAPHWAFAAILEMNNKYEEQRPDAEEPGPFPAGQISYTLNSGGNLNLWFGKRQAGYLCSGGVCKFEPAFEGVELFGIFRY